MICSDLQEDFLSVEEEEYQPAGENVERMPGQLVPIALKPFDDAAEEKSIDSGAVNNPLHHVDGNGIHADDSEEERPTAPASYVDDIIEDGEADKGVAAHGADKGAAPELFVDGEGKAPQPADQCKRHASQKKIEGFFVAGKFRAADPLSREHAQHGGDNGRNSAEQAFRIKGLVVEMAG